MSPTSPLSEAEPLIPSHSRRWSHNAHPFWLIPVVIIASMARGMSQAPRIEIYRKVACKAILNSSATTFDLSDDCATPDVHARAAAIQALVITVMSILSAITTGPLSRYGDNYGRKSILALSLSGALAMELMFILVTTTDNAVASQAFVVIGAVVDGLVGGLSVFNGVIHAYTSDCTEHGSRSKIFSTLQGMVFVGLALGPWLGNLLISAFHQTVYLMFYLSAGLLVLLLTFVIFVLPESLKLAPSRDTRPLLRISFSNSRQYIKELGSSLAAPITIFMPTPVEGSTRQNYNVTFVGAGLFIYLISIGVFQTKYLYATYVYNWSTRELGLYMSLLWLTRAINLLVVLPLVISYFKPKPKGSERPSIFSEMRFDSILARCSLFVDGSADFLIAIIPISTSAVPFVVFSCVSSFTSGGNPAMHSLGAVCLHAAGRSSEVGSLFGAMAFLAHTISPTLYAVVYSSTVQNFPKAIFYTATILLMTTVALLSAVKSDQPSPSYMPLSEEDPGEDRDDTPSPQGDRRD